MEERFDSVRIWRQVVVGNADAFELVVTQYQSAVSAIAYCITGNVTQSQDIAQETFLVAWKTCSQLQHPERLGAWLCGIARNVARQEVKNKRRSLSSPVEINDMADDSSGPLEQSISAEEQTIVQVALDGMPETYREAMVLFYRQGESITEVAECLGLSEEATRQRLSRGRALIRDRLLHLVKETLVKSRPSREFTKSIMGAIGSLSLASQVAQAATPTAIVGAVTVSSGKAAAGGALSAVAGSLGGMLGIVGAWVGQWFYLQFAETETERALARDYGRKALTLVVLLLVSLLVSSLLWKMLPVPYGLIVYLITVGIAASLYQWQLMRMWRAKERRVTELREFNQLGVENNTWLRRAFRVDKKSQYQWRGRSHQSRLQVCGLPVIDIQIGDPGLKTDRPRKTAHGWIAIGDHAYGRFLALGETATGLIAIGGKAKGLFAFGGIAIGGVAVGGIATGASAWEGFPSA